MKNDSIFMAAKMLSQAKILHLKKPKQNKIKPKKKQT